MITLTNMHAEHWDAVKVIYEEGISTGNATFQTAAPSWQEWDNSHLKTCRIIAIENNEVLGWAALTPVSSRCVYAGVAEVSVYVGANARGKNIGTKLLRELINQSEQNGIWTLQSGIFPENKASIAIHEKNGFRIIGYRERIGKMGNVWRDNISLERRSNKIGID
ncbi:MAG: N-acetyltransferase [Sediminibacterium sp.]|nr:N-acetyltransferase [Sediminibacterium sp.]MBX9779573.1 GNAT family N-acetyltransferase [Chitinophagaceae bacterium]